MAYDAPSFETIRTRGLREIRSLLPDADIGSDSDNYVRISSVAAVAEGIHQQGSWTARQIFPDSADFDELKKHASTRGVYPKSATAADSTVAVVGTAGKTLPASSQVRHTASGTVLTTTAAVTLGVAGTADAPVTTTATGSALNGLEGPATLTSPPLGINSACSLSALKGGTDDEKQESLLARYLDVLRNPPSGGNLADYRRWALSVDGVSTVLVIPKRRGGNAIDVVITSAGGPSSAVIIAACQAYLESVAPAGAVTSISKRNQPSCNCSTVISIAVARPSSIKPCSATWAYCLARRPTRALSFSRRSSCSREPNDGSAQ